MVTPWLEKLNWFQTNHLHLFTIFLESVDMYYEQVETFWKLNIASAFFFTKSAPRKVLTFF